MLKPLVACVFLCGTTLTHAACAISAEPQPQGVVGLQLFYPDDPRSWGWADDLGVTWLRIEFRWDWIEPYNGRFDASYTDRVMGLAASHPQKIMVLFNHVPNWATSEPELLPERAAAALTWLAKKYSARVAAWEIFNEPNLPGFGWPNLGISAQHSATVYAKTLSGVSSALRAINRQAFVVSAGLSPQNDPEAYARWLLRLTPPACYDAFGLHPYGQQGRFATVLGNVALLLAQEQRPPKPVWFTEYGTNDDSQRVKLLTSLAAERSSNPITFFFTERDIGTFTDTYGLRRKDGSPKPDYDSFKRLMAR